MLCKSLAVSKFISIYSTYKSGWSYELNVNAKCNQMFIYIYIYKHICIYMWFNICHLAFFIQKLLVKVILLKLNYHLPKYTGSFIKNKQTVPKHSKQVPYFSVMYSKQSRTSPDVSHSTPVLKLTNIQHVKSNFISSNYMLQVFIRILVSLF